MIQQTYEARHSKNVTFSLYHALSILLSRERPFSLVVIRSVEQILGVTNQRG
jgi:hypothetical protein